MLTALSKAFRAAILPLVSGSVGERVYADLAPTGATMPYIVISIANSMTENRMSVREAVVTFNVQVVVDALTSGDGLAAQIYDGVFDGLRDATLTIEGWDFHRLEHMTSYRNVEVKDRQRFAYAGGLFRVEADKI